MPRILMVAFQFPPWRGSSGVQRTLKFRQYLGDHGWDPVVLTADPRAYPQRTAAASPEPIADGTVTRAFALDAARHLAVRGRYSRWLALPDRWSSWVAGGVPAGLRLVRERRPSVLWSTFPVASAHLLALVLHRLTGLPWVADFRDSMTEEHYPEDPRTRRIYRWIEARTVEACRRVVFTAPGARDMYADRYPHIAPRRWELIPNGYDEDDFLGAERHDVTTPSPGGPLRLVHSGLLYRSERDPRAFFAALGDLRREGRLSPSSLRVVLRASGDEDYHRGLLREHGVEEIVGLEPPLPYREALAEMLAADGLLLFQASNCNHQIPAKVYEYLRAGRPIFALTDPAGDTARTLVEAGAGKVVRLDSRDEIRRGLAEFLDRHARARIPLASPSEVAGHSREQRTRRLAELLDRVLDEAE